MPFEVKVPLGRHAVPTDETPAVDAQKSNTLLRQMETRLRDEEEKRKRMLDKKRIQKLKRKNLPKAIAETSDSNALLQFDSSFKLPQPAISEQELREIAKYASSAHAMQDNEATNLLVGQYSNSEFLTPARQTPMVSERINKNAQDLVHLRDA